MKPRGVWIYGNWKMNHGSADTARFFSTLQSLGGSSYAEIKAAMGRQSLHACLFAPALSIARAQEAAVGTGIDIGAQNAHWEKSGAFTGELSGAMLLEAAIKTVLVGHSERRQYFGETDATVLKRSKSLLEQGLRVVLCIGETRAEREAGQTQSVLTRQVMEGVPMAHPNLLVAYEPVWAIGTGLTATPEQAEEAHQIVRKLLWDRFGMEASGRTPILYGGSVTPENLNALLACPNVDGGLIGGASLKPESYLALLKIGASQ